MKEAEMPKVKKVKEIKPQLAELLRDSRQMQKKINLLKRLGVPRPEEAIRARPEIMARTDIFLEKQALEISNKLFDLKSNVREGDIIQMDPSILLVTPATIKKSDVIRIALDLIEHKKTPDDGYIPAYELEFKKFVLASEKLLLRTLILGILIYPISSSMGASAAVSAIIAVAPSAFVLLIFALAVIGRKTYGTTE